MTQNIQGAPLVVFQSIKVFVNTQIRFGPPITADNLNGAVFHPAAGWLTDNGNCGALKEMCVELYSTKDYLQRRTHFGNIGGPSAWMLHHEMSHAYHYKLDRWGHTDITEAYDAAMKSGKYNSVPHVQGGKDKAYACNNQMEYFASIAAAWFCENDWYPFNRKDVCEFDPQAADLMRKYYSLTKEEIIARNGDLAKLF